MIPFNYVLHFALRNFHMNTKLYIIILSLCFITSCQEQNPEPLSPLKYPDTFRDDTVTDDYHGSTIADPYRWLEDDNSSETADWVNAQNEVTFDFLDHIPFRNQVKERLTELWDYEKFGNPYKVNDQYYFFKNDGLQNQSVLYRVSESGDEEVILDPNTMSDDGTTALGEIAFSNDGRYLAYFISEKGSDWRKGYIMDLRDLSLLDDELMWIKFSTIAWHGDGFYYSRYPSNGEEMFTSETHEFHSIYYHRLGDSQDDDQLIFRDEEFPLRYVLAQTTDDEKYLILMQAESTSGSSIRIKDLSKPGSQMIQIVNGFDFDYTLIPNSGDKIWFLTNENAPNQKIVTYDPGNGVWTEMVSESEDVIQSALILGQKLVCEYLHNASSQIKIYDLDGTFLKEIELPSLGSVAQLRGKSQDNEAFFSFTSYTSPTAIYSFNTADLTYEPFRKPALSIDLSEYVTDQVWFTSKDGTKVPMFLTYHKDVKRNGQNPCMLYGYGGFNVSLTPGFSVAMLPLLENGGIYAVANLRGGGEFGKTWHQNGTKEKKQNVFDDFIAAAEYLISEDYTSSDKLAIRGGSNGGLLVGAAMTQRPDLFKVAIPAVGVLDMLRYHKFTIGWAWASDYGVSDNADEYEYLIKYSPLHNVRSTEYPATLITTADHDDRVVPAHSFKFAAELQSKHTGNDPALIRIEKSAGHGAGKPTSKIIDEYADVFSFMYYNMDEEMSFEVKD